MLKKIFRTLMVFGIIFGLFVVTMNVAMAEFQFNSGVAKQQPVKVEPKVKVKSNPPKIYAQASSDNSDMLAINNLTLRVATLEDSIAQQNGDYDSLQAELVAIRAILEKYLGDGKTTPPPVASLTSEQETQKVALEQELADKQAKLAKLNEAVAGGLDRSLVESAIETLNLEIGELETSIVAITPKEQEYTANLSLPERLDRIEVVLGGFDGSEEATEEAYQPIGINIDIQIASAYAFRGLNVFQESSQSDANFLFAPGITWSILDTGVWLSYWAAYQINGDNRKEMVDVALGHEQDIIVGYDYTFDSANLTLSTSLVYYFYPFASETDAGVANPSFLEPFLGVTYSTWLDIGLTFSYFAGLQDVLHDLSYLYINPSIGKEIDLGKDISLAFGFAFGYKHFKDENLTDNVHDVAFDTSLNFNITDLFYISPSIHVVWTNMDNVQEEVLDANGNLIFENSQPKMNTIYNHVGNETMIWGGVNIGVNL